MPPMSVMPAKSWPFLPPSLNAAFSALDAMVTRIHSQENSGEKTVEGRYMCFQTLVSQRGKITGH